MTNAMNILTAALQTADEAYIIAQDNGSTRDQVSNARDARDDIRAMLVNLELGINLGLVDLMVARYA